jgi:ankyrin repeat protein
MFSFRLNITLGILSAVLVNLPLNGQESGVDILRILEDSTAIRPVSTDTGKLGPVPLDTTSIVDGYVADTAGSEWFDTSFFNPGDPEANLLIAAEYGELEAVKMLVERGVNVDADNSEGVTALMYASQNGEIEIMEYLLSRGADVNRSPRNDVTPLIGAARTGQYEAVVLLLDSGARVDDRDEFDLTALMHASAYNYPDIVEVLLEKGAKTELGDWYGSKALMMAAFYNCVEAADVLLDGGADPDGKDDWGFTPLMVCAQHGDYDLAWLLLDKGADPNLQNKGGMHAIALATLKQDKSMIELLTESSADINQDINSSTNALSLAKESGKTEMISYLEANGAKLNRSPEIFEVRGSVGLNFNGDDFMIGFDAGVSEYKYKLYLTTGFLIRPGPVRVLRPENDTLALQLWEKRYVWPITLGRDFLLGKNGTSSFYGRLHLSGALTWGSYRGSSVNPDTRYMIVPGAGITWKEKYVGISFDYQYIPMQVNEISNHRFTLALIGFYDFRKRVRYTRKDISWF